MSKFKLEEVTYSMSGYSPEFKIIDSSIEIEKEETEDGSIAYLHGVSEDVANSIIEILGKQVPKKAIINYCSERSANINCPNCDYELLWKYMSPSRDNEWNRVHRSRKYCKNCGQKLDWD